MAGLGGQRSGFRAQEILDFDVDDFADHEGTDDLHDDGPGEHLMAHRIGEEGHRIARVEIPHDDEQHGGQSQQDDAREAAFAGEGLDLAPDLEALADQVTDLVEDFGQVTTRLTLQDDRRGEAAWHR